MTPAAFNLMRALTCSVAEDEAAADDMLEIVEQIEDRRDPHAATLRTLARMHRAKAIANRARLEALAIEYDRRTNTRI